MSLLISISFDNETKDSLMEISQTLKKCSRKGVFYKRDDLKMNILLLNEIDDIRPLQKTLETLELKQFNVKFTRIDRSRREGGDIYWAVAEDCPALEQLYSQFKTLADEYEYEYEDKPFKARVQLGNRIIARPNFNFNEFSVCINNIKLYECTPLKNKELLKEIYARNF